MGRPGTAYVHQNPSPTTHFSSVIAVVPLGDDTTTLQASNTSYSDCLILGNPAAENESNHVPRQLRTPKKISRRKLRNTKVFQLFWKKDSYDGARRNVYQKTIGVRGGGPPLRLPDPYRTNLRIRLIYRCQNQGFG